MSILILILLISNFGFGSFCIIEFFLFFQFHPSIFDWLGIGLRNFSMYGASWSWVWKVNMDWHPFFYLFYFSISSFDIDFIKKKWDLWFFFSIGLSRCHDLDHRFDKLTRLIFFLLPYVFAMLTRINFFSYLIGWKSNYIVFLFFEKTGLFPSYRG